MLTFPFQPSFVPFTLDDQKLVTFFLKMTCYVRTLTIGHFITEIHQHLLKLLFIIWLELLPFEWIIFAWNFANLEFPLGLKFAFFL